VQVLAGKWRIEDFTPQPHWDGPYFGADWGFSNDPSVLVKLWVCDNVLYMEAEVGRPRLDMDQLAEVFATLEGSMAHRIRADAARPETINELNRRGFTIEAAPKWSGSVEDGIAHLRSYSHIVLAPSCQGAIQEARLWRYKTTDAGDPLPQLVDAHNHRWDAARYALAPRIRRRGTQRVWYPGMTPQP
jgi:phage terminase large subunit